MHYFGIWLPNFFFFCCKRGKAHFSATQFENPVEKIHKKTCVAEIGTMKQKCSRQTKNEGKIKTSVTPSDKKN